MPDGIVDPPGLVTGAGATGGKKLPLPLIIGGAVAVVGIVIILVKKKSNTGAAATSGAASSPTVIYPDTSQTGTDQNDIASYYNSLQTGIANSTGTTAQNIQSAQDALSTDIAGVAATTSAQTPVSASHAVPSDDALSGSGYYSPSAQSIVGSDGHTYQHIASPSQLAALAASGVEADYQQEPGFFAPAPANLPLASGTALYQQVS
jgi:hypothetical protein